MIKHSQYLSQIVIDLGGAFATLSYVLLPLAIIQIPVFILRTGVGGKLIEEPLKPNFIN